MFQKAWDVRFLFVIPEKGFQRKRMHNREAHFLTITDMSFNIRLCW